MYHMINDQIEAYRRAVETRAKAEVNWHNDPDADTTELRACREEEQLRLDGLHSVIGMLLQNLSIHSASTATSTNLPSNHLRTSRRQSPMTHRTSRFHLNGQRYYLHLPLAKTSKSAPIFLIPAHAQALRNGTQRIGPHFIFASPTNHHAS